MKKIFLLFVAVCALFACDPTHEKISNDGHSQTSYAAKALQAQKGKQITCYGKHSAKVILPAHLTTSSRVTTSRITT